MRKPDWESILANEIEAARRRPFVYGQHDCATWAFDVRKMLSGNDAITWRGSYSTEHGAAKVMRQNGWHSLEDMGRKLLGTPLSSIHEAMRGDIVLDEAFGICVGATAVFPSADGLLGLPLTDLKMAWRV